MSKYDPHTIEGKWQKKWLEERIYEPDLDGAKKPFYNLMMFPYPSAEGLHVGNMYAFTGSDIYGRFKRMQGYDVFEPIGLDGFGIHSENYALKVGAHPADQAKISEKRFYEQLHAIGNGFAWDEHLETYDPEYYHWTQWLFVQMWKHGLAYRKKQAVNWCPKDKTVLADEQAEGGKCERCGAVVEKKELEQWFLKITHYAEQLLKNIPKLDWSEKVKIAQTNWIGKSEGAEIKFQVASDKKQVAEITVFTTRPDTLFGATYMVLSPEHEIIENLESRIENLEEVKEYIKEAKKKKEEERAEGKEKTGVELKGLKAINPTNNEEIPIWVADYVLASYGTGAIMAVPAHDERDFEFAKKYKLPIRQVIAQETGMKHTIEERRDGGCGVIFNPKIRKYAVATHPDGLVRLFGGGVNDGENMEKGVLREITEESGLHDFRHVEKIRSCFTHFYNSRKQIYRSALATCFLVILGTDAQKERHLEPHEKGFDLAWMTPQEIVENWGSRNKDHDLDHWFVFLREAVAHAIELGYDTTSKNEFFSSEIFSGTGILIDSGKFDGMDSETAKWEITKFVHGERKTQYRLRDWLISRQRYWGPPIPMIFCETCASAEGGSVSGGKSGKGEHKDMPGWYAVPESDLPVKLPYVKDFRPTGSGTSPLASVKDFYEAKCPACGGAARRETDVSDTFLDSAWYFLRYPSVHDNGHVWNLAITKKWLPVDSYIGGAEHSVLHLLYSRFVTMVFRDIGLLDFDEPFTKFIAHGLITKDGAKMSKSKGNVVNPDEYIRKFGADILRMYLMFLAPFEQGGDFRDGGILGIERFLKRVWQLAEETRDKTQETKWGKSNANLTILIHKTIKKVTEDIEHSHYNTAISALMILLRGFEDRGASRENLEIFLKLLAPFAPHITEETWRQMLGYQMSIHREQWPKYDSSMMKEDTITLVVQINGKMRDAIPADASIDELKATQLALQSKKIGTMLGGKKPKRVIYVPKKIVNIVID